MHWITEKAREFQKNIYFCFIDYAKAFDSVNHNKLWKILQEREYQTLGGRSDTCLWSRYVLPAESVLYKVSQIIFDLYFGDTAKRVVDMVAHDL